MIESTVEALGRAPSMLAARRLFERLLDVLTPAEYRALGARMSGRLEPLYADSTVTRMQASAEPEPYRRRALAPNAVLYADPSVPTRHKLLAVCFAGRKQRMMIPNVAFLQCLPAARYDILILADPETDHFRRGCQGYAPSFLGLVRAVARDLPAEGYDGVVSFGVSMGGLPAAWYGLLAGTTRAICVGGRRAWDMVRLDEGRGPPHHDDPLCACAGTGHDHLVFIHGADNAIDRANAAAYAAMLGGRTVAVPGIAEHSFLHLLWTDGILGTFLGTAFDPASDLRIPWQRMGGRFSAGAG